MAYLLRAGGPQALLRPCSYKYTAAIGRWPVRRQRTAWNGTVEPRSVTTTALMAALETASNADICKQRFQLDLDTINPHLRKVQYAVRGPVLDRAMEIERDLLQVNYYESP